MRSRTRLFTVMVVLIAATAGGFFYLKYSQHEREAVLKRDLRKMREAIDNYTFYEQQAPQSLEDLVRANYLHEIPVDPVCQQMDWQLHFGESVLSPEGTVTGVDDVHSGCGRVSTQGSPYNTW